MSGQTTLDGYKLIAQTKRSEQSERIDIAPSGLRLVRLTGIEPATSRVGVLHSIQLSYKRMCGAENRSLKIILFLLRRGGIDRGK